MALSPAGLVWLGLNLATGDITCTPTTGEITFTGNVPVVTAVDKQLYPHPLVWLGLNTTPFSGYVTPNTGALAFTGNAPTISLQVVTIAATGTVTFTGNVPGVVTTSIVQPTTGLVSFTGNPPGISQGGADIVIVNHDIPTHWYGDVGHAARFAFMPVGIRLTNRDEIGPIDVEPGTGVITFEGNVPLVGTDITAQPNTGELEFSSGVITIALDATVEPVTGEITFTGNVPGINLERLAEPRTGEILFTGYAPFIDLPVDCSPQTGLIEFLSQTPTIDVQEQTYTPTEGVIVFYGNVPVIDGVQIGDGRRGKDGGLILRGKKKRPLLVKIDDEEFIVETVEEAETLLAQAKDVYKQQVNDLSMQLLDKASTPTLEIKPVRMPRIRAEGPPGPDLDALIKEVAEMRAEIRGLYERAAAAQKKYVNDDDEALALLL